MFSKGLTSLIGLLTSITFLCVSCAAPVQTSAPSHTSIGEERFHKGERAVIIDILRQSRDEMLNKNLDMALNTANLAKEKSEALQDNLMRYSSTLWASMIALLMKNTAKAVDYSSMDYLKDENIENLFYNYLLVMYDLNAFDLKDKRLINTLLSFQLSDKDLISKGSMIADGLRKGGETKLADLIEKLFKSYAGLIKGTIDQDSSSLVVNKRKTMESADEIVSITETQKMEKEMSTVLKVLALYIKLIVVGSERDMALYEKTAKRFAGTFSLLQKK
ncbi:MAG: hypothetical protein HQL06_01600 [Nitrospirae bacterium]|nr:hypothetical protein [Nitrospirota bacterium]